MNTRKKPAQVFTAKKKTRGRSPGRVQSRRVQKGRGRAPPRLKHGKLTKKERIVLISEAAKKVLEKEKHLKAKNRQLRDVKASRKRLKAAQKRAVKTKRQRSLRKRAVKFWRKRLKSAVRHNKAVKKLRSEVGCAASRLKSQAVRMKLIRSRVRWSVVYQNRTESGDWSSPIYHSDAASDLDVIPLEELLRRTALHVVRELMDLSREGQVRILESDGYYVVHTPGAYAYAVSRQQFDPRRYAGG